MCSLLFSSFRCQCFSPCFHIRPSICFSSPPPPLSLTLNNSVRVIAHGTRAPTAEYTVGVQQRLNSSSHSLCSSSAGVQKVTTAEICFCNQSSSPGDNQWFVSRLRKEWAWIWHFRSFVFHFVTCCWARFPSQKYLVKKVHDCNGISAADRWMTADSSTPEMKVWSFFNQIQALTSQHLVVSMVDLLLLQDKAGAYGLQMTGHERYYSFPLEWKIK